MPLIWKNERDQEDGGGKNARIRFNFGYPVGPKVYYLYKNLCMNLFVAGLPYDLDDAELEEIFEKFGKVLSAKVSMDRETGKSRGFGFVQMEKEADAKDAIEHLNDISLGKKPLVVKAAEERPGGGGGGYRKPGTGYDRRRY